MHTLANYLRQTGALVTTIRFGFQEEELARLKPDLLVLSPGPGNPKDFDLSRTIDIALRRKLPVVGVCLGLQACPHPHPNPNPNPNPNPKPNTLTNPNPNPDPIPNPEP